MQKSPFQFYDKPPKSKDNIFANFSLQNGKIGAGSKKGSYAYTEDEALQYLAKTLVEAYFKQKRYDRTKQPQ